jgi:hypothetical protein
MSIRVASVNGAPPAQTPFRITMLSGDEFAASRKLASRYSKGVLGKGNENLSGALVIPAEIWGEPVTSIRSGAFSGTPLPGTKVRKEYINGELTSVVIPNGVTSIGAGAFAYNQLTSVVIPNSVTAIGRAAFAYNQLTSVVIPNSVTAIGPGAFEWNQLTSIVIPNSVRSIGEDAFMNNNYPGYQSAFTLSSVTIGANLAITVGTIYPDHYYSFVTCYNKNGKKAGTYRYEGGQEVSRSFSVLSDWKNWKYYPAE